MSLFGALFSGVSGLGAQGTSMGVIADNITNVSTVGYKTTTTNFKTLVTVAATATSFAPGGVQAAPQQLPADEPQSSGPMRIVVACHGDGAHLGGGVPGPDTWGGAGWPPREVVVSSTRRGAPHAVPEGARRHDAVVAPLRQELPG